MLQVIIFSNLLDSLRIILEAMEGYDLTLERPENEVGLRGAAGRLALTAFGKYQPYVGLVIMERELSRGEPFPREYQTAFRSLWADPGVKKAVQRGNEFALHDNMI